MLSCDPRQRRRRRRRRRSRHPILPRWCPPEPRPAEAGSPGSPGASSLSGSECAPHCRSTAWPPRQPPLPPAAPAPQDHDPQNSPDLPSSAWWPPPAPSVLRGALPSASSPAPSSTACPDRTPCLRRRRQRSTRPPRPPRRRPQRRPHHPLRRTRRPRRLQRPGQRRHRQNLQPTPTQHQHVDLTADPRRARRRRQGPPGEPAHLLHRTPRTRRDSSAYPYAAHQHPRAAEPPRRPIVQQRTARSSCADNRKRAGTALAIPQAPGPAPASDRKGLCLRTQSGRAPPGQPPAEGATRRGDLHRPVGTRQHCPRSP